MSDRIRSVFFTLYDYVLHVEDSNIDPRTAILVREEKDCAIMAEQGYYQIFYHELALFYGARNIKQASVTCVRGFPFATFTQLEDLHVYGPQLTSVGTIVACQQLKSLQLIDCYGVRDFYVLDCLPALCTLIINNTEAEYLPVRYIATYIVLGANNIRHRLPLCSAFKMDEPLSKRFELFAAFNATKPELTSDVADKIRREKNALMAQLDLPLSESASKGTETTLEALMQRVCRVESMIEAVQADVRRLVQHFCYDTSNSAEYYERPDPERVESDLEI